MDEKMILKQFNAPKGAQLDKVFKNGNIQIRTKCDCYRCGGGRGIYYIGVCNGVPVPSHVDNGVCFRCGGRGWEWEKRILMTPENEAKKQARLEKERAKREAEAAQREAERKAEEERKAAEEARKAAEEAARKAISQHVGKIGERLELTLTLKFSAHFEVQSYAGFGTETIYIHNLVDEAGNVFVWKTGKTLYTPNHDGTFNVAEKGDSVRIKGTVKAHSEYKEEKQTELTRCKTLEVIHA